MQKGKLTIQFVEESWKPPLFIQVDEHLYIATRPKPVSTPFEVFPESRCS